MSGYDLDAGTVLRNNPRDLPDFLRPLALANGFRQRESENEVLWYDAKERLRVLAFTISDPRDLDSVVHTFTRTKTTGCPMTYVFVHQWSDGEGNWDVFTIRPDRALRHRGRYAASAPVIERGPQLRSDIYTLFECDREFPPPGRAAWARLLAGPTEPLVDRLDGLATEHRCSQEDVGEGCLVWMCPEDGVAAMFFLLPDPGVDAAIRIYREIGTRACPVTFVFLPADEPEVFDIFRLSTRSFLEHHNQARSG